MEKSAIIDGPYRYRLARIWDPQIPPFVYVMLNPSTADADQDDPTIRVCMGRARRAGAGGIVVVNLFAFRATKPEAMKAAADPVGEKNDFFIRSALTPGCTVVGAWGADGRFCDRDYAVRMLIRREGHPIWCIGRTRKGDPCHPLRQAYSNPLIKWSPI